MKISIGHSKYIIINRDDEPHPFMENPRDDGCGFNYFVYNEVKKKKHKLIQ